MQEIPQNMCGGGCALLSCHAAPVRGAVLSPPTARKLSGALEGAFPLSLRFGLSPLLMMAARFVSRCEAVRAFGRFPSVSAWPSGRAAPCARPRFAPSVLAGRFCALLSCHAAPVRGAVLSPPTARKLSGALEGAFPLSLRFGLSPLLTTAARFFINGL